MTAINLYSLGVFLGVLGALAVIFSPGGFSCHRGLSAGGF
jgi:hypothetical protein